jgi:hypothetical protein
VFFLGVIVVWRLFASIFLIWVLGFFIRCSGLPIWRSGYELSVLTLVAVVTLDYISALFLFYTLRKAV